VSEPIHTINDIFRKVAEHDLADCLMHKIEGRYVSVSTAQLVDHVHRLATALDALGVRRGDRVGLMADNGPHWPAIDFATLAIGGVLVPIYPTLTSDQAAYVVNDCGAEVVLVQGEDRLTGLLGERSGMPNAKAFVSIGDIDSQSPETGIPTLADLLADHEPMEAGDFANRSGESGVDDLATFIYTSGTTGNPKGVKLSHGNIASNVAAALDCLDIRKGQTALSFLPLSHSFERTVDYTYFYVGLTIAYAESVQTVAQNMGEVKPHVFVSVPRVYEKVLARVRENVAKGSPLKRRLFEWAARTGREALPYRLKQQAPAGMLGLKLKLADKLVFGKLRGALGGRFEAATSGGAPLARDVAEFFWAAGIEIYEGYGLSETSPVLTVNRIGAVKLGTVGKAIEGVELQIAEDGEILAKGPNIMKGYHNLPEKTAEVIDDEGWFHTGDIGEIDDEGFLKITDRKKEIIVNAYGKNIAPAPIENALKASRFIEQAMVIGDKRKFLSALLVPDFATLQVWADGQGIDTSDREALTSHEKVRSLFEAEIADVNKNLGKYQLVNAFGLLGNEWTIETEELTPTQKIKRRIISKKYAAVIDSVYERAEAQRSG